MTKKELLEKLKLIAPESDEQRNSIICSLIGHSKIVDYCFGYITCARCGTQLGDCLGGAGSAEHNVIVGHKCEVCEANSKKMTWKDKLFCPDPFREGENE